MNYTTTAHRLLLRSLLATGFATTLTAQDVYLSEVRADTNEVWIELHNRGAVAADLSEWSLHASTTTPSMPQNYWWPFPAGTTLQPDAFLRVHWFHDEPAVTQPGDYYTGTLPYGFLFGFGGETLHGGEGAIGLLNTQDNLLMNSSSIVEDWVSWGSSGFERESLAVAEGLWSPGRALPSIPVGGSLARDVGLIGVTQFADESWFVDSTPTPLLPNVTGAVVQAYGTACTLPGNHLLGQPELRTTSLPLIGNGAFGLVVDHTTGILGEYMIVAFSTGAAPAGMPSILPHYSGVGCQEAIDATGILSTWLLPTTILGTPFALPLDGLSTSATGLELHVQSLVIELLPTAFPPYQGISNALRLVIGN